MLLKPPSCSGCPLYEPPFGKQHGFVPADGSGRNGVLIVLEAAGAEEEQAGIPVVGKAGHYLFTQLKRIGLDREDFRIHNVLSCRPPGNQLAKMPYEGACIAHCAPNLDATIGDHVRQCGAIGRTPVILTLGRTAFKRIMGFDDRHPVLRYDYQCYPHWQATYKAWVVAADHPSYLMRGNHHLTPVMQFAAQRAVEVARDGMPGDDVQFMLDPNPQTFGIWVQGYLSALEANPEGTYLTYDIETPYKSDKDEAEIAREDEDDYTILRVSFAYKVGEAVSVPWNAHYFPYIQALFQSTGTKVGWNSSVYDDPRIMHQTEMRGCALDGMLAWHVLNSAMPKGLGFVAPFYCPQQQMWKHKSEAEPALYNAIDAHVTLQAWQGIARDLVKNDLWEVFNKHVIQLNQVLTYMSRQGVLRDETGRAAAEAQLQGILDGLEVQMADAVPQEARKLQVYKKEPKDTTGMVQVAGTVVSRRCPACGATGVSAVHFKSVGKKRLKGGEPENPCHGNKAEKAVVETLLWAKPLEWKISKVGLEAYQAVRNHKAVVNRKENRVTFDDTALKTLIKQYPTDPLYPVIGKYREAQKLLSTYVGITRYKEVEVPEDYELQPGEMWKDAV